MRVEGPFTNETFYSRLVLNHYAVKSEEDYTSKVARGSAMSNGGKGVAFWERVKLKSTARCWSGRNAWLRLHGRAAELQDEGEDASLRRKS